MYLIQEVLVSDDIIEKEFSCDLQVCKGACCWKGDYGAPLDQDEINYLEDHLTDIYPYLTDHSKKVIEDKGFKKWYKDINTFGTQLHKNGACVFMTWKDDIAQCGIEQAYKDDMSKIPKPISCQLYPIRIIKNEEVNFEAANYSQWSICAPGRKKGMEEKLQLVRFLKAGLIRKYGTAFYEELYAAVLNYSSDKK